MALHSRKQSDDWFERRPFSLEEYRTGTGLTLADKRVIYDAGDLWKISLIQNTLQPCQDLLYSSLMCSQEAAKRYFDEEKRWLQDEFYYLGIRLGRKPTSREKEEDFEKQRTHVRFRLFYTLKWPEDMRMRSALSADETRITRAFFTRAGEISFRDYLGKLLEDDKNRKEAREEAPQKSKMQELRLKVA
jgi:hypothetical protein